MPSEKFFVHKEDGSLVRLKGRLVRFLDEEPPTGSDKSAIRTALEVSPDAEGLVQADVGTDPQNLVLHQHLGDLAYQSAEGISVANAEIETLEVTDKVAGPLTVSNTSAATSFILANSGGGTTLNFAVTENTGGIIDASEGASARNILFKTGGTERLRIDSSGNVGIGTDSPQSKLHVFNSTADNLRLERDATNDWRIRLTGGALAFHDATANVERWSINSSGNLVANGTAIDFGSGDTLDSYEEGTWTPTYAAGIGSFTTMDVSYYGATYTKIGRLVHYQAYLSTTDVDVTGASGNIKISGLPFSNNYSGSYCSLHVGFAEDWTNAPAGGYIGANSSTITLTKRFTGITGELTGAAVSDLQTGTGGKNWLMISGTYMTNT